jgi:hypothetical protein
MPENAYIPRLKTEFEKVIVPELTKQFGYSNRFAVPQLDKIVLTKGTWATLMFLYQELDKQSGKFRAPKMAIVRFKKFLNYEDKEGEEGIDKLLAEPGEGG